ncbi:hypothetical protein GCM10023091_23360 [Ravibacter arvi]|uniref:Cyclic nucleotide-binding domain-containing protein n=1 Tax=Ravibacter arvi TaxID=2051041 RepID=A0ABP8M1V5_9BACT
MKSDPPDGYLEILREHVARISPLPDNDWSDFSRLWTTVEIPKKRILTTPGEVEPYLYFVLGGLQRIYHLAEDGREATIIFTYPYSFSGIVDSAITQTRSNYFFETLSDSIFLRTPAERFLQAARNNAGIGNFVQLALAHNVKGLLHRLVEIQSLKSEEKFKRFMERSPHMLHIVPHRYLANYLGIDPTNFSKFINRIVI